MGARLFSGLFLSLAGGFASGAWWWAPPPDEPPRPTEDTRTAETPNLAPELSAAGSGDCEAQSAALLAERAALTKQLVVAEVGLGQAELSQEMREGAVRTWPDTPLSEDAVGSQIEAILANLPEPYELVDVDCSEPPCLVAIGEDLDGDALDAKSGSAVPRAFFSAFGPDAMPWGLHGATATRGSSEVDQRPLYVLQVGGPPPGEDPTGEQRTSWRTQQFAEDVREETW